MLEIAVHPSRPFESIPCCPIRCGGDEDQEWRLIVIIVPAGCHPLQGRVAGRLESRVEQDHHVTEALRGGCAMAGFRGPLPLFGETFNEIFGDGIKDDEAAKAVPDDEHTHFWAGRASLELEALLRRLFYHRHAQL